MRRFLGPQSFPPCTDFDLLYVSHDRFEREMVSGRHSHECTEIFFCIHGKAEFMVRDAIVPVEAGDFVIVPPMVEHGERSFFEDPLEYAVIGLSKINICFSHASKGFYKGNFAQREMLVFTLLNTLLDELEHREPNYQAITYHSVSILLEEISRLSSCSMKFGSSSDDLAHTSDYNIFWVKQYIDDNFTRDVNLDLLSAKIGLNKYSLIRKFKLAYGISPINYLLERKFESARFLLQTTETSIKQIAESVGFSSASYFAQSFTRHEGVSPTEYRQAHR